MAEQKRERKRNQVGYGSSYRRGRGHDLMSSSEVGAVLGNQVWMIKPDKAAQKANPCIWMQAGAVNSKNCNNFYDCTSCKYDMGMQKKVAHGKQISWQDVMRKKESLERICRHSLTNRIQKRACAYNYECSRCDFDQFFEDVWSMKAENKCREIKTVGGFRIPTGYYFHNGHTWGRIENGGYIRIGMDDFSHKVFGEADALDLPLMGKELDQGIAGWGLKREGNEADVLSPVDGVIMEVNPNLRKRPGLAKESPYEEGWMFMVRSPDIKGTVAELMADKESLDWMNLELDRLESMIESVSGPLATDGGYLADDIYGNLPELGWGNLTRAFLRT